MQRVAKAIVLIYRYCTLEWLTEELRRGSEDGADSWIVSSFSWNILKAKLYLGMLNTYNSQWFLRRKKINKKCIFLQIIPAESSDLDKSKKNEIQISIKENILS